MNGELKVGSIEETITVSGTTPLVDVQSLTKQTVFTREVLDALPAAHNIQSAAVMVPGVTVSGLVGTSGRDVGGNSKLQQPSLVFRGTNLSITRWDGFHLSNLTVSGAGGGTSFYVNDASAQELVYTSGAESADMAHPGLYVDLVPKDGGNRFNGYLFGDFTYSAWSASNLERRPEGARHHQRRPGRTALGFQSRHWRPDPERQALVLRGLSLRNRRQHGGGQLLRQEPRALPL